jgi:alginate O-acetyltransferase complex protein AlgI
VSVRVGHPQRSFAMLFNSVGFLFVFLPVLLIVFFWLGGISRRLAATWLTAGSLFFYGYWNPVYVGLLLGSIAFNYAVGYALARGAAGRRRGALLFFGVAADLALLGYFKYANFFIGTLDALGGHLGFADIVLPLGISFFTFTQIAFLVDAARGEAKEFDFVHYALFVTYYPHLIAGPVLHHKEMMPQFGEPKTYRFSFDSLTVGLTMFSLGLFKKTVLADSVAPFASQIFGSVERGDPLSLLQAWGGALAYTLQLYFDFSGYSDMAIGLSYCIGVKLPLNFNSPYKAADISDFWRRWHMTLSRFLRDYLYVPLGGNRHGNVRRYGNLMATMLLGGLWHGAGWTFVIWGGLHGLYLCVHHAWQAAWRGLFGKRPATRIGHVAGVATTFLAVVIGWVFFRAPTLSSALAILHAMFGLDGVTLPDAFTLHLSALTAPLARLGVRFVPGGGGTFVAMWAWVLALLPVIFLAPNTQQILNRFQPALDAGKDAARSPFVWIPRRRDAIAMAIVLACGLLSLTHPSEFLYFQF